MPHPLIEKVRKVLHGDGHLSELLRGSSTAFLLKVAGRGIAYVLALVVARTLGADAWGVFSLALAFIAIGRIFSVLGIDTALLRYVAQYSANGEAGKVRPLFWKALAVVLPWSVLVSILAYEMAPFVARSIFNKPELSEAFRIASLTLVPLSLAALVGEGLRGLKQIRDALLVQEVLRIALPLGVLLLFLFAFNERETEVVVWAYVLGSYVLVLLALALLIARTDPRQERGGLPSLRALLTLALPLLLAGSMQFLKGWIDTIMVGVFLTKADVGVYDIAYKLSSLTALSLWAVNSIAAPKLAGLYSLQDHEGLSQVIHRSGQLIMLVSLPVLFFFFFFPEFVMGVFGEEFRAGATALSILSLGYFLNAWLGIAGYVLVMTDKQVIYQNIVLGTTIVSIALNYLLIPKFGINGAAFSTAISLVLYNVGCAAAVKVKFGILTLYNPLRSA